MFVGGCATGLLVTDPAAADVRPTYDVDAIAEITSYAEYTEFSRRLRDLRFVEDHSEGAPICRWLHGKLKLDVMPIDERILGFSNRWYKEAIDNSQEIKLAKDLVIRVVTAPYFLATKMEAFKGRGRGDYFASHDLEDVVAVIDGRSGLMEELLQCPQGLREYLSTEMKKFLGQREFIDALPGYLLPDPASQGRLGALLQAVREISGGLQRKESAMRWEEIGPKLRGFSSKVSVIHPDTEVEKRVIELVEELERLLNDPRNRPA